MVLLLFIYSWISPSVFTTLFILFMEWHSSYVHDHLHLFLPWSSTTKTFNSDGFGDSTRVAKTTIESWYQTNFKKYCINYYHCTRVRVVRAIKWCQNKNENDDKVRSRFNNTNNNPCNNHVHGAVLLTHFLNFKSDSRVTRRGSRQDLSNVFLSNLETNAFRSEVMNELLNFKFFV